MIKKIDIPDNEVKSDEGAEIIIDNEEIELLLYHCGSDKVGINLFDLLKFIKKNLSNLWNKI